VKSPRSTRMRHRQWRELFETFTLFFSLALLLLCAGFVMQAIKAPDWVAITVILFALPCFVASVLKPSAISHAGSRTLDFRRIETCIRSSFARSLTGSRNEE
jgi:uncharacterized membrane protein